MKVIGIFLLGFILTASQTFAQRTPENQVFQYVHGATSPTYSNGKTIHATGYLWIPENCKQVKGLLLMARNGPEHVLAGHKAIREVCRKNDLGLIWFAEDVWYFATKTEDSLQVSFIQQIVDSLAIKSGYDEIKTAPWLPLGESGHLLFVRGIVNQKSEKCLAGVCLQDPSNPPTPTKPGFFDVPMLWTKGTAYEWTQTTKDITKSWLPDKIFTRPFPNWLLSAVIESGSGHWGITDTMIDYICKYIDTVVKLRLPKEGNNLNKLSIQNGVLAQLPIPNVKNTNIEPYKEGISEADRPWFPNLELAKAAQKIAGNANWNAQTQLPIYTQNCVNCSVVPFSFNSITAITVTTSSLFSLETALADSIPAAFTFAGTPLAKSKGKPTVEWICGSIEETDKDGEFKVIMDRGFGIIPIYVRAYKDSTKNIRYSTQPAAIKVIKNNNGTAQTIDFEKIADIQTKIDSVKLKAVANSGLPVSFSVISGPAIIRNNYLVFTKVPPRSVNPIAVTVQAYQWGTCTEPLYKTASVRQTFKLYYKK